MDSITMKKMDPRFPEPLIPEMDIKSSRISIPVMIKNWTINNWYIQTRWLHSHCMEIEETTNCRNIYIWGGIHGVEDGRRRHSNDLLSFEEHGHQSTKTKYYIRQ